MLRRFAEFFAGLVYGLGARIHRRWMARDTGARGRPACAIVSVGGITLGGAGKTPVAARLARSLHHRGYRVVIASRGYRGEARQAVAVISDGEHVRSPIEVGGDESLVLAAHAPGVPVLVGRDRGIVGHHAVAAFDAEILVLDDGFQHHRIARDFDLVCIDAASGVGNGRVVPAGPLREPVSALRHADAFCLVDGVPNDGLPASVEKIAERRGRASAEEPVSIVRARREPMALEALGGGETQAPDTLKGKRVGLLAGIGRPRSFRHTLEQLGAEVVAERIFPDHHGYDASDLTFLGAPTGGERERPEPDVWITTEKDALKILPKWVPKGTLEVLRIEARFEDEEKVIDRLIERLRDVGRLR